MIFFEGIAAGAMLTMIAAAMIPEAVHMGGERNTGIFTLIGFLGVLIFKLLSVDPFSTNISNPQP